jgi:hypothetical protein
MRLALALALVACTTTKTAEQHAEVGLETRNVERVETHTEEGEWSVKTWEFAPGDATLPSAAPERARREPGDQAAKAGLAAGNTARNESAPSGIPTPPVLLRYSEEVHSPTKITSLADAEQQTTLKVLWASLERWTRSWWPPAWLLACLALGAAVALWALRRKISALKGLL